MNGSGFAPNSNFTVTLGGVSVTPSVTTTDYLGRVNNVYFDVPSGTPAGSTTITVTDSASPPNSTSIGFTVYKATIAISPTTVATNSSVTVSGTGWPANDINIQVYIGPYGNGFLCYASADASGAFSKSCLVLTGNIAQGTYTATATDNSITATGNAVTFIPAITYLSPTYANPTNTATLSGSGFAANSNFSVVLGSVAVIPSVSITNSNGGLGFLTFDVPSGTPAGATTITVTDSASPPNSASIAFTVYHATIAISPTTAAANSSVTVSGTGWPANGTGIRVYLGPVNPGSGFLCYAGADASGAISQSCQVAPYVPQGTYTATASDFSITTTGNQVTVTPVISYTIPAYANPTNPVQVVGFSFAASSNLTVKLGSVAVTPSVTSTDTSGRVNFFFDVPSGTAAGATTITVTDSATPPNSASIAFTVYNATISVSPTTVSRGGSVTVSGTGWASTGGGIGVYIGPVNTGLFICFVYADASGTIAAATCTVPFSVPTGTFDMVATDSSITATGNQVTVN
jgi:hypothetical protein